MGAVQITHILFNALLATWMSHLCFFNPVLSLMLDRWERISLGLVTLALLVLLAIGHCASALAVGLFISVRAATLVSASLSLHWSFCAYYLLQRFRLVPWRPMAVLGHPLYLPSFVFLALLSTAIAILASVEWYWVFLLLPVWLLYGYCCAEAATRLTMRKMAWDRRMAISAINQLRPGIRGLYSAISRRYPFP